MEPVDHRVGGGHPGPELLVLGSKAVRAQRGGEALGVAEGVVGVDEAGADEQDVADLDVPALAGGADVDALGFAAGGELVEGDFVARVGICGCRQRGALGHMEG
jgi:hypothetical protein